MKLKDFDYDLPDEAIAYFPPKKRGQSRLLTLDKNVGTIAHNMYPDIINYVNADDVVVLNNTKVIKARLIARNSRKQTRELLLIEKHGHDFGSHQHKVLYRGKIKPQETLWVGTTPITVESIEANGIAVISSSADLLVLSDQQGSVPLPPYIKRETTIDDQSRYQTVFATQAGSIAAPTASLNFTDNLENMLKKKGVKIAYLTLHVGLGTFLPIRVDDVSKHQMHSEYFEVPKQTVKIIQDAKESGHKILAIGTTVTRTLEFCADEILDQKPKNLSGEADIFIYPGKHDFKVADMLLTNFHAPRTTVLMLASAFASWPYLRQAYLEALGNNYKFLSYGDSMLIY